MTAPAKPTIDEQILQNQLAEAEKRVAVESRAWTQQAEDYLRRAVIAERQLAACQKECEEQARLNGMGSEREARLMAQLAELQRKHDGLVARLREPVDEYLNISDLWKKSEDDAEGMDLGHPTQAHYFAALLQQAMSAVALREGEE